LDDLGYVSQTREETKVLFTIFAERYERGSVMISSNLVFSKWDQIFQDPMTAMAVVDRLGHQYVVQEFAGESHRSTKETRGKIGQTTGENDQTEELSRGGNSPLSHHRTCLLWHTAVPVTRVSPAHIFL
jgi:hypothetical protein